MCVAGTNARGPLPTPAAGDTLGSAIIIKCNASTTAPNRPSLVTSQDGEPLKGALGCGKILLSSSNAKTQNDCQVLVPSPVPLDPIPNRNPMMSKIQKSTWDWGDTKSQD